MGQVFQHTFRTYTGEDSNGNPTYESTTITEAVLEVIPTPGGWFECHSFDEELGEDCEFACSIIAVMLTNIGGLHPILQIPGFGHFPAGEIDSEHGSFSCDYRKLHLNHLEESAYLKHAVTKWRDRIGYFAERKGMSVGDYPFDVETLDSLYYAADLEYLPTLQEYGSVSFPESIPLTVDDILNGPRFGD